MGSTMPGRSTRASVVARVAALAAAACTLLISAACGREDQQYSQATPEDVLKSAVAMVKAGDARLLPKLLDDGGQRDMRAVLNRLGNLTGSLQRLAGAVAIRFPGEVAKLKEKVIEEAQGEQGQKALEIVLAPSSGAPAKGGLTLQQGGNADAQREIFQDTFARLMADPFSFLERAADKLSTEMIDDERAAVLYDGKPVPPVGLTMRLRDGKWYIELPINLPMIRDYMPQTHTEHQIVASLIKVFDNTIKDLTQDVGSGRVATVTQLSEKAGERALVPAGMVMIVYAKEMETRRIRERSLREFGKRLTKWSQARDEEPEAGRKLGDMLTRLAVEELDKLVRLRIKDRKNELPKFEPMPEPEFAAMLQSWLASRQVKLDLASTVQLPDVEAAAAQVAKSLGQIASSRKK